MNRFSKIPDNAEIPNGLPSSWKKREPILNRVFLDRTFIRLSKIFTWCSYCDKLANRKTGFSAPDWVFKIMEQYPKSHGCCEPCKKIRFPGKRKSEEDMVREIGYGHDAGKR